MKETYKRLREFANQRNIVLVTAKQPPRQGPVRYTPPANGILIIDYIGLLK